MPSAVLGVDKCLGMHVKALGPGPSGGVPVRLLNCLCASSRHTHQYHQAEPQARSSFVIKLWVCGFLSGDRGVVRKKY